MMHTLLEQGLEESVRVDAAHLGCTHAYREHEVLQLVVHIVAHFSALTGFALHLINSST